ncbi:MAG: PEGA domain-containing protein [Deltaproteobacteria bacterium]|nr:PEGA domain-containing protein [Deltaproteobacteria bacterium]
MRRQLLAIAFVVAVAAARSVPAASPPGGSSASPAPSTSGSASGLERAREAFAKGVALFDSGDYAGALEHFAEAESIKYTPAIHFNVARCLEKLGKLVHALEAYRRTEADALAEGKDSLAKRAVESATQLEPHVPKLTVVAKPSGAKIAIDGVPVSSGVAHLVDPGKHTVVVSAPKLTTKTLSVSLAVDEAKKLAVALP